MSKPVTREEKVEKIIDHYSRILEYMRMTEVMDKHSGKKPLKFHKMSIDVDMLPEELELMNRGADGLVLNEGAWKDPSINRTIHIAWERAGDIISMYLLDLEDSGGSSSVITDFYLELTEEDPFWRY